MHGGRGHVHGGPGHAVGGATGHPGDLLPLQTLHQGGLPVHRGGAVALLPVVVISPRKHLKEKHETEGKAFGVTFKVFFNCSKMENLELSLL